MKGVRVFVPGGAGVIGRELVRRLIDREADVLVGDLKPEPDIFRGKVRYREGDLNTLTMHELKAFDPHYMINLAATFERSVESLGFWEENFVHNVRLSHHLMTLAQCCKELKKVVFASSYLIYDEALYQFSQPQSSPRRLTEKDPIKPRNLTGMAKFAHEHELQFLQDFSEFSFTTVSVRIFRGYGCGSRDVISRWIRSLIRGESIDVYRSEGCFDYIYAADSAEGLIRLATSQNATGVVNLGTGESRKVADVVEILRRIFPASHIRFVESDIPYESSEACTIKLESLIGWKPVNKLEDAIPKIVEYEKSSITQHHEIRSTSKELGDFLVTSASRKIPLIKSVKKAALRFDRNMKVTAGDIDPFSISGLESDSFWEMRPLHDDSIEEFIADCRSRKIGIILPTRDGELEFWARHKRRFCDAGINVIVSDERAIKLCRDKLLFSEFGSENALPIIPASLSVDSFDGCPLVVKERYGAGSRGLGLNLSRTEAIEWARRLEEPIFQPFVSGPEISIDSWVSKSGVVAGVVLRRRDRVFSGESQITTTFRDVFLEEQAISVLKNLQLRGPVVMQAIVVDGGLRIIECNPRFGGASTASIAVGLDSFYWSIMDANKEGFIPQFERSDYEVKQVRMPEDCLIYDYSL